MIDDSGMMDWSPGSIAQDLSAPTPRSYYRDLVMPGGFPLTPSRPSTPVFERVRPAANDGRIYNASKRLCTTVACAANNATVTSMTSIIRSVRFMQSRMRFPRRAPRIVVFRTRENGVPPNDQIQSPPATRAQDTQRVPLATSSQEAHPSHSASPSQEAEYTTPPKQLTSPFQLLKTTYGAPSPSLALFPDSSPSPQLDTELDAAADDPDDSDSSISNSLDGRWMTIRTPPHQIKAPLTEKSTNLSSAIPDTAEWYHSRDEWAKYADLTSKSPGEYNTAKSGPGQKLEDQQVGARQKRRALLKAKAAIADTSKFDIKPLSKEWESKVTAALKNGHGRLQARDFQKIVPPNGKGGLDAWLNDESINEYLSLVTAHANKDIKPKSTPRMHAFSTFFFTSLKSSGYQKVARWAKRANLAGAALLDVEKIFIPINPSQSHWTLAVIEPRIRQLTHYNSLGSGNKGYLDVICEWLKGELGAGFVKDDWVLDFKAESPQQANTSDCGVFTVTTAKQLMLGISPMEYSATDIPTQRKRMVAELVNGKLLQNEN